MVKAGLLLATSAVFITTLPPNDRLIYPCAQLQARQIITSVEIAPQDTLDMCQSLG